MQSYTKGSTSVTYKYDENGLRTSKTVNGVQYDYYYVGDKLVYEKKGDEYELFYRYDADGRLAMVEERLLNNNSKYFFYVITNSRGDVVEIRSGAGSLSAKYTYDAWGKLISMTDANGNALGQDSFAGRISVRYRGYYYDKETGLYYLQSRYYDPDTGRFLNVDDVDYIGLTESDVSYNAFAYCENDPVNCSDVNGRLKGIVTAVGFQVEVSGSVLGLSGCVGFEQIYCISKNTSYTYIYLGAGLGYGYDKIALDFFKSNFSKMAINPKISLKNFTNLFKFSWSVSVGFFIVRTWGHFSWPDSYLGMTNSNTLTISCVKGFYAKGNSCASYGVSYSYPLVAFSISETAVKYYKASTILKNVQTWLVSRQKDIMKAVGKYAK